MRIANLGPLEVRDDADREIPVPGRRLQHLLLQLAADPGRWVPAGTLTDAVWADETPADPANSLQSLVSRLRRVLGRPQLVEQSAAGYRLAVEPGDVDAVRFPRLVADARARTSSDPAGAEETLREALSLWRGRALAEDDTPEAAGRRSVLDDLRLDATRDRSSLAVRAGRAAEVVPELEELVVAHPLREDLALTLLDALVAAGRPAEALAVYERVRATLAETLGADPSPALRSRHLQLLQQAERPLRVPSNLRAAVTSFVGRDDDVRAVLDRLATARLVTVVGTGGAGKTRLVGEVADRVVEGRALDAADGVWLVELASVTEPTAVWQAVLDSLGSRDVALPDPVADYQRRAARDRLLERLRPARCLLVVDNCEHLVDAAAEVVAEVLARCPGVRVLATSREPLAIEGELLHPLGPLPTPPEDVPWAETADSPAVRLLLDRARAVDPQVALDDAVVEIVRRLDGLPLAIELAAARLRVLSPAEVADRLGDRFQLLTGGRRTATPRHRTLRAVVEWSWELLTPLEREVAEHVSVFASGATEAAVAAVAPSWRDGDPPGTPLADVLHALVDKSLLIATRTGDGTRFRMLETLREYGGERLAQQGLVTAARTAHARWFLELVRRQDERLRGPGQLAALRAVDTDRDDVLAALRFLGDAGHAADAIDLVVHLGWYWLLRESGQEATLWTAFALAVPGAQEAPHHVLAEALQQLLGFSGGADAADLPGEQARLVALADRLAAVGSSHPAATVLRPLLLFMGEERTRGEAALADALADPDPWVRAAGRLARVLYAENDGDVDTVRREADAAVAEWEAIDDRWGLAAALSSRGLVRTVDGDLLGAVEDYERARECIRALGSDTSDDVLVTMRLADLRLRAGDVEGARRHAEVMRAQPSAGRGRLLHAVLVEATEGAIAVAARDDEGMAAAYSSLDALLAGLADPGVRDAHGGAVGHAAAAGLAVRLGRIDRAGEHLREGYAQALLTRDRPILAAVATAEALWLHALGLDREAAVVHGAAVRLRGAEDPTDPSTAELVAALRATLDDGYDAAFAEGRALDPDEAVARIDPGAERATTDGAG
ncbi:BTAD domain-containing putative transcriptional regulator [Blastococcus litoris]|uniref:BTAD domain-containing putative transcriptional regulator n=1 Tax=Blastococcus litoris TaxID=2171622 RepID=UPI000E301033|nr:BTAD domain-containing putative transcriptional regulator [Blastococcus litoris]